MNERRKRVLVVEDNADNRYLATHLLESEGFEVRAAENGSAALQALEDGEYAAVLLDLQLPDIDGFEVARRARQRPSRAALPIIAVSAFGMARNRQLARAVGCAGFLEKPIDAEAFVGQVRSLAGLVKSQ